MATGKRFYWIKLKESFLNSDAVDFLMSQTDGANYVVLYQILCLKTINTGGKLERRIGEVIIPYDEEKIQRDAKWFTIDTVRVALNLYKALGLIYQDENGILTLAEHSSMVGSETDYAQKNRQIRSQKKARLNGHSVSTDVSTDVSEDVSIDIDIRDREKILDIENRDREEDTARSRFIPPAVEEVAAYCEERGNGINPQKFVDYYTSNGWMRGKTKIKDWRACVRTWEGKNNEKKGEKRVLTFMDL